MSEPEIRDDESAAADRRTFMAALGRFSVVTPPAISLLLSTSLASQAIAASSGECNKGGRPDGDRDFDR
ncbi:hypothetical protein M2323_000718 [Rhodoblastus acidophilus]|uniref:hypothetical protein n=1 Tax=Rhodoblastus acidophilus TaxID=1074 RepID=UPI002224C5FD|nr:hypothetical protein [Rhodoblastus acidophilus]MCW2283135.1 hypothetical protein [Rhodoblastus acidophilus]MCW2331814.1 hypothetical protein [Rhodoblastus acidophilus]